MVLWGADFGPQWVGGRHLAEPSTSDRLTLRSPALGAAVAAYVTWGIVPLAFQLMGRLGIGAWEVLAHRVRWGVPAAVLFVLLAGQGKAFVAVLKESRTLAWLALSAVLIGINWGIFIWAVNDGRVLETSLGYFLNPLLNMAAGALVFGETIGRPARVAIGLAAAGVALQALALGHLPWVSLGLAVSFCAYGIVRKQISAEAQTGFLVECLILAPVALMVLAGLHRSGLGHFASGLAPTFWLVVSGPMTAIPLVLFSWAARRVPLSTLGFVQFIAPTMTFVMGLMQGEAFTPLRALSFALIWTGVAIFLHGAWSRSRAISA